MKTTTLERWRWEQRNQGCVGDAPPPTDLAVPSAPPRSGVFASRCDAGRAGSSPVGSPLLVSFPLLGLPTLPRIISLLTHRASTPNPSPDPPPCGAISPE